MGHRDGDDDLDQRLWRRPREVEVVTDGPRSLVEKLQGIVVGFRAARRCFNTQCSSLLPISVMFIPHLSLSIAVSIFIPRLIPVRSVQPLCPVVDTGPSAPVRVIFTRWESHIHWLIALAMAWAAKGYPAYQRQRSNGPLNRSVLGAVLPKIPVHGACS